MKTVLFIVIGILIAVTLGLLVFSIINIVKCYKGVKTCTYERAIFYFKDAIENYWISILLNALMFIINTTYLFLLVFNVIEI